MDGQSWLAVLWTFFPAGIQDPWKIMRSSSRSSIPKGNKNPRIGPSIPDWWCHWVPLLQITLDISLDLKFKCLLHFRCHFLGAWMKHPILFTHLRLQKFRGEGSLRKSWPRDLCHPMKHHRIAWSRLGGTICCWGGVERKYLPQKRRLLWNSGPRTPTTFWGTHLFGHFWNTAKYW